jgi:soluble lytic murein transglycosylase-like protein
MRISAGLALLGFLWPCVLVGDQLLAPEHVASDESLFERWPAGMAISHVDLDATPHTRKIVSTAPQSRAITRPTASAIEELIMEIAGSHNVDTGLVRAVIQVESTFNPSAVSSQGASGLMQLMPYTAEQYGVRNILDPSENIRGGVQHLQYLLKIFKNDTTLALAAYNAGVSAVRRYQGVPPYKETQAYVQKVLELQRKYGDQT